MPAGDIGKLEPLSGQIAHLQHDGAAGGAAVDLDIAVALVRSIRLNGSPRSTSPSMASSSSCAEAASSHAAKLRSSRVSLRHAEGGRQGGDQKLRLARFGHGQQRLRLRRKQRVEHALASAIALSLAFGGGLGLARAFRGAETGDRGPHREGDDAETDAERQQRAGIERGRIARGHGGVEREAERREWRSARTRNSTLWPP